MSHRGSAWFREAETKRPLMKVSCQHPGCDYVVLTANPETAKVAHAGSHYGHPHRFNVVRWKGSQEQSESATEAGK